MADGSVKLQTDLYEIVVDPNRGGTITRLIRKSDGFDFVSTSGGFAFNGLRGNFYDDDGFHNSADSKAQLSIIDAGPLRVSVAVTNTINGQPYKQMISIGQGQPLIDCILEVDWKGNPGIGAYNQQKD
ncbi:MAG TPA: hypothetical protein VHO90_16615, partial [Bacteroidales bacterium]|nr:hypothetical protein [Bacteroidales bacterium]